MVSYDQIPKNATLRPTKYTAHVSDKALSDLNTLIELSPIGPETYENTTRTDGQYGISRPWLKDMKSHWLNDYSWRRTEEHINSFPNFTVPIKARDGDTYSVHFAALFSSRPDAIPVCLLHGWPGSFLEFLPFLTEARQKYQPDDLPYHYIVPSLIGYGYSSGPSVKTEWRHEDLAYMMNELMVGLVGSTGYIAHGGDIGSFVARILAVRYDACKAIHLNFCMMTEPSGVPADAVTAAEKKALSRMVAFGTTGNAYAKEHGTKGGTIGLVLSSSPLALLSWIGEKFIEWTDETPSWSAILDSVTLYWLTDTFPRAIYPYIDLFGRGEESTVFHPHPDYYVRKPIGYSYFPFELAPVPLAWAKTTGNIVWHRAHTSGGHFAAMEKPKELLADQEEFIAGLKWGSKGHL